MNNVRSREAFCNSVQGKRLNTDWDCAYSIKGGGRVQASTYKPQQRRHLWALSCQQVPNLVHQLQCFKNWRYPVKPTSLLFSFLNFQRGYKVVSKVRTLDLWVTTILEPFFFWPTMPPPHLFIALLILMTILHIPWKSLPSFF